MDKALYGLGVISAVVGLWLVWQGGNQPDGPPAGSGTLSLTYFVWGGSLIIAGVLFGACGRGLDLLTQIAKSVSRR